MYVMVYERVRHFSVLSSVLDRHVVSISSTPRKREYLTTIKLLSGKWV